jgi:hypothetical protein
MSRRIYKIDWNKKQNITNYSLKNLNKRENLGTMNGDGRIVPK